MAWSKIQYVKFDKLPKFLRIYSKFQKYTFGEKKYSLELLEKAKKIEQNLSNKQTMQIVYQSDLSIEGQEEGIIFITMEEVIY